MAEMIKRALYDAVKERLFEGKAIIVLGARQVGKTTLFEMLAENMGDKPLMLNCDDPEVRLLLDNPPEGRLDMLIGSHKAIIIDEGQRVDGIGLTIKRIIDTRRDVQVLVTGSSSLELRDRLNEPLTGRKWEYMMYPISTDEIYRSFGLLHTTRLLESRLIYGSYPEILTNPADAHARLLLLADSYLYKDILSLESVRRPELLNKLLTALALQIGSEVSYNELASTVGTDAKTVEKYIGLLEKCFIVFRLGALSRNLRNELKKSKKIYFYDNGIRNALIKNFSPIGLRNDEGALWENFFISERIKYNHYHGNYANTYFWRTAAQQEIDYVEECDGTFRLFEMKWNPSKGNAKFPKAFTDAYPTSQTNVVTPQNYLDFLI